MKEPRICEWCGNEGYFDDRPWCCSVQCSTEFADYMLKKWKAVLDYRQEPTIEESRKRLETAVIIESAEFTPCTTESHHARILARYRAYHLEKLNESNKSNN